MSEVVSPLLRLPPALKLAVLYVSVVGIKILLSLPFEMPFVWGDAFLYANRALHFARSGIPVIDNICAPEYPPLYSFLISPAYVLDLGVQAAYRLVLVINALVNTLVLFPAYFLCRKLSGRHHPSITAALLVTVMPGCFGYSFSIMAENLLIPLTVFLVYQFLDYGGLNPKVAFLSGLITAFCVLTKSLAWAFVPATLLLALLVLIQRHKSPRSLGCFFLTLLGLLGPIALWGFCRAVINQNHLVEYPDPYPVEGYLRVLASLFSDHEIRLLFLRLMANQFSYLGLGTFGLALVAGYAIFKDVLLKSRDRTPAIVILLLAGGTLLLGLTHSVFNHSKDPDQFTLMGRYIDPLIPVLVVFGVAYLSKQKQGPPLTYLIWTGLGIGLCVYKVPWLHFGVVDRMSLAFANHFVSRMPFRLFFVLFGIVLLLYLLQIHHRVWRIIAVTAVFGLSLLATWSTYRAELSLSRELSEKSILGRYIRSHSTAEQTMILMFRNDFLAHSCFVPNFWRIAYETRIIPELIFEPTQLDKLPPDRALFVVTSFPRLESTQPVAAEDDLYLYQFSSVERIAEEFRVEVDLLPRVRQPSTTSSVKTPWSED